MAYDRYQVFDLVTANSEQPYHNKGVMVLGTGVAEIFPRVADNNSGVAGNAAIGTSGGS